MNFELKIELKGMKTKLKFVHFTKGNMKELTEKQTRKQDEFKNEMLPHLDSLYNFGLRLTADPIDAEDLVQDTIVKAYRFFGSYERGTNAKAWLFRILKNSYINGYRKKTKIPQQVDYHEVAVFYETIRAEHTESSNLERNMYRQMMDDDLSKALNSLPEDFRTVVLLCDVEDFTYEEIANMLDVPIGTIRSRLHRGRNLLKAELVDYAYKRGYIGRENGV